MDRIKDYVGFTAWFVGLGYIVLWPMTASELGGQPFGASMVCRDTAPELLDFLCKSARSLAMPPGLHAIGFTATLFVTLRLLCLSIKRSWRARRAPALPPATPAEVEPPPLRTARPYLPPIKRRDHFGLRGVPR